MAEKFPEIETTGATPDEFEDDFLAREKAALGDDAAQFTTEQDAELLADEEDDEVKKFEEQFPTVSDEPDVNASTPAEEEEDEFSEPASNLPKGESDAVKEWRERYNLEIQQRDENDAKKAAETREAAEKELDTFYEEYNNKKDASIEKVRKAEEEFIAKRDEFFQNGNVWSRSLDLVKDAKVNPRFKELLTAKSKATRD
ncbi:CYFA0S01e01222g1_1 [Cyberlindnera fabianii]|uniref:Clathrin light chain n=1 Tax=Cyberlindnera fabianii TaxID=36022 RepID=A0A061AM59_CYBFA|nr:Clathrin light chain [Cyberlindnera fabianii]CDR36403.1 CYFA0S01e01222g1_1 [Cyberlindnera fabianii]